MSREFGSEYGGYFHNKIGFAAEDALGGRGELTRLWGEFLSIFSSVAYQISNYEASDSGYDAPIFATIHKMEALKESLDKIRNYVYPYESVAAEAIRNFVKNKCGPQ